MEEELGGFGDGGAGVGGLCGEDFTDSAEDRLATFGGREVEDGLFGEEKEADLVTIIAGTEAKEGCQFGRAFAFAQEVAAVIGRC